MLVKGVLQFDGLMQIRYNSSVLTMELRLLGIRPSLVQTCISNCFDETLIWLYFIVIICLIFEVYLVDENSFSNFLFLIWSWTTAVLVSMVIRFTALEANQQGRRSSFRLQLYDKNTIPNRCTANMREPKADFFFSDLFKYMIIQLQHVSHF